jgi:hypothetical protein
MKRELAVVGLLSVVLCTYFVGFGYCETTFVDDQVTLTMFGEKSYFVSLTSGSTVSINISVLAGGSIDFGIYNSTQGANSIFARQDVRFVQEQWTAPYADTFEFYITIYGSSSTIRTVIRSGGGTPGGGGFDPLPIVVVVIVVLVVLISAFLIVRMRRQPPLPPPPEEQPPPPP